MNVRLPCGDGMVPVDVPDNWINGRCYRAFPIETIDDLAAAVDQAAGEPVGGVSIESVSKGRATAAVAVDASRPEVTEAALEPFLRRLEDESGLDPDAITVIVANDLWGELSHEDLERVLPAGVRERYPVVLHDPRDAGACKDVGETRSHVPIRINSAFTGAELRILFGPVAPHLIHGFSGGRSILMPGLAHASTSCALYSPQRTSNESVVYGIVQNNPFHVAGAEAVMAVGVDLTACVIATPDGKPSSVRMGNPLLAFTESINELSERMRIEVKEPMDIVVTDGGGAPYDGTLYQLMNALFAAKPVLKPHGTYVVAADLGGGVGPDPLRDIILACRSVDGFRARYGDREGIVPGQWVAQRYLELLARHEVIIYAPGMDDDLVWKLGLTPTGDLQEAIHVAMQGHGQRCKICALPDGPASLARLPG